MVQVSYPGVYIQEVSSGVHTITGVSTSIAAFIGRASNGPINQAIRCLSMADFNRTFGSAHPKNLLSLNVRQFFDNGGTDCYIIRLAPGAEKADIILKNLTKAEVLLAKAKYEGKWGNSIRLEIDYNTPTPDETFNMKVTSENGGNVVAEEIFYSLSMDEKSPRFAPPFVSQSSNLISLEKPKNGLPNTQIAAGYSQSFRPLGTDDATRNKIDRNGLRSVLNELVHNADEKLARYSLTIRVNDGQAITVDLRNNNNEFPDESPDKIIAEFERRINDKINPDFKVKCTLEPTQKITGSPDGEYQFIRIKSDCDSLSSVRIQRGPANDIAGPLMLGIDQGGIEIVKGSDLRPVASGTFYKGELHILAGLLQKPNDNLRLAGKNNDLLPPKLFITTKNDDNWFVDKEVNTITNHSDGVREKLRLIVSQINKNASLPFKAELWGYRLAFRSVEGSADNICTADFITLGDLDLTDNFVENVRKYQAGTQGKSPYVGEATPGQDENGKLMPEEYFGDELDQTGIHALDSVDIFNLMVIPEDEDIKDESEFLRIYSEGSNYCKAKRAFLLMNAPVSWTNNNTNRPKATQNEIKPFRAQVVKEYSAVFYPQIKYVEAGIKKSMGPSGMIAGLIARIDSTRGLWKAPAGIEATLIGLVDLEVNLTDRENGVYNKLGVNCLRIFPNGFVNWGARTMAGFDDNSETEWKYIPIRRLALYIEESLYRGTKWVVFEPNDEPLWAKIRLNIRAFMMSLFRQGAFQGTTPDKAFYVKCDRETTTWDDQNKGIVNIEVGFAPLKPAEFVVIKIQQMAEEL